MAYLGDLREGRFGPNGEVWEMDNRVEKRYYWNGAYTDLCDMEPEEAMKHVVNVKVVDDDFIKSTNKINISVSTESDGKYVIKATASKAVASDVTVVADYTVVDEGGSIVSGKTVIKIPVGQKEASAVMDNVVSMKSMKADVTVGSSESGATGKTYTDDTYNYTVSDFSKTEATTIPLYWGIYPYRSNMDDLVINKLENKADKESYKDFPTVFRLPGIDKDLNSAEEVKDASYRLIYAIPEEYSEKMKIVDDVVNADAGDSFVKDNRALTVDGKTFALLVREEIDGQLASLKNEVFEIPYKITLSK